MRLNSLEAFAELRADLFNGMEDAVRTLAIPAGTCGRAGGAETGSPASARMHVTDCHWFCEMAPSIPDLFNTMIVSALTS